MQPLLRLPQLLKILKTPQTLPQMRGGKPLMTKLRTQYLYKFTGIIHKKYQRKDKGHPQHFYQLKVELAGSKLTKIFAFQNKTKPTI